ncbi:MAG: hypothetical protein LBU32_16390 [Clostridiales bacterium]|jgi:hypothetical protein|nr:hypothetical protein [Clostridiales bacterium]
MRKHFMKHSYKTYHRELNDGTKVLTTREDCFRFDPGDPDHTLQRWEWDDTDDRAYVIRLAATPEGKERGLKFDRERKRKERNDAYIYGCMAKGTKDCEWDGDC